jgi:hypothetical protein
MGDEDIFHQVKKEDDGVVALGGSWTHINMRDVDGIGQVKKEGKCIKLGGGRTRVDIGGVWWFHPQNRRKGLVVSASKPSEDGWLFWASKPDVDGLMVCASKPSVTGLTCFCL